VQKGDEIVAFANMWSAAGNEELSIDLMRHLPSCPETIMDYLFAKIMLWGAGEGYQWFNLGMAPLSGLDENALAPFWSKAGTLVFRHGEHFYNFQGLRQYKEKFTPEWHPKYLACRGGLAAHSREPDRPDLRRPQRHRDEMNVLAVTSIPVHETRQSRRVGF